MKENGDQLVQLRSTHDYEDLSGRFRLHLRNYDRQFCNIYSVRIVEARRRIEKVAATKWSKYRFFDTLSCDPISITFSCIFF